MFFCRNMFFCELLKLSVAKHWQSHLIGVDVSFTILLVRNLEMVLSWNNCCRFGQQMSAKPSMEGTIFTITLIKLKLQILSYSYKSIIYVYCLKLPQWIRVSDITRSLTERTYMWYQKPKVSLSIQTYSNLYAFFLWEKICFIVFVRVSGERYMKEILQHGGGRPPADMVENLIGKKPTIDSLVTSLVDETRKAGKYTDWEDLAEDVFYHAYLL